MKGKRDGGRAITMSFPPFSTLREETKRKIETDGETRPIGHCLNVWRGGGSRGREAGEREKGKRREKKRQKFETEERKTKGRGEKERMEGGMKEGREEK